VVTGEGNGVGGLVGWNPYSTINNSYSISIVTGENSIGGLVGEGGTIYNSYSTGTVTGKSSIGGLVGKGSVVNNSYSTGAVTGQSDIGGLMGFSGRISNSYSTGAVTGESNVGGLIGNNWNGNISNSYSTGRVTGNGEVGGLVGNNIAISNWDGSIIYGDIYYSYYDSQTSGQNDADKGSDKTTAEMKLQSTFINWNFEEIWGINSTINDGYPYLLNIMLAQ
jgi:hypothetical protein